jgi:membrane protein
VASASLAALRTWWAPSSGWTTIATLIEVLLGFVLATAVFAMIYKFMPRVRIAWKDVGVGAVFTALLFTAGKHVIGLYIGKSGVSSSFGAAASLVVLLVWVYYSAQIFLLGAEFTWAYAHRFGSRAGQPLPGATAALPVRIEEAAPEAAPEKQAKP